MKRNIQVSTLSFVSHRDGAAGIPPIHSVMGRISLGRASLENVTQLCLNARIQRESAQHRAFRKTQEADWAGGSTIFLNRASKGEPVVLCLITIKR